VIFMQGQIYTFKINLEPSFVAHLAQLPGARLSH
jgi:hypothetical protein